MTQLALVWNGGPYGREYVDRLCCGVRRHTRHNFTVTLVADPPFPGWWQKLMIFPPFERTVYLDLDVVITGNLDFLFEYEGPFCIWGDPWSGHWNSSVMSIAPGFGGAIRERFLADPLAAMRRFHSDQDVIYDVIPFADTWQRIAPGRVKSYKADALEAGPGEAAIVVFHGEPKPHQLNGWVRDAWI